MRKWVTVPDGKDCGSLTIWKEYSRGIERFAGFEGCRFLHCTGSNIKYPYCNLYCCDLKAKKVSNYGAGTDGEEITKKINKCKEC